MRDFADHALDYVGVNAQVFSPETVLTLLDELDNKTIDAERFRKALSDIRTLADRDTISPALLLREICDVANGVLGEED